MSSKYPTYPVVLVDDDPVWLRILERTLITRGVVNVLKCESGAEVQKIVQEQDLEVIILDLTLPDASGLDLLRSLVRKYPEVPVIIVTGHDEVSMAVNCMREGAFNYFLKTEERENLVAGIRNAIDIRELRLENLKLRSNLLSDDLKHPEFFKAIITRNSKMRHVFQYLEAVAPSPEPVLITGESGTGKELVARAIHELSGLPGKFIPVTIAGEDEQMVSDTLFGHRSGAYTGAAGERRGLVEEAAKGTLFLDEIGDLALDSQIKLLRLIQEREYRPLGSDVVKRADIRVVAATNRSLEDLRCSDTFREDLFYRLRAHHAHLPPLRDRCDDLPLLLDHFLEEAATMLKKKKPSIPDELPSLLSNYDFPGNIREFRSMVYDALSRHKSKKLSMSVFEERILSHGRDGERNAAMPINTDDRNVVFNGQLPSVKEMTRLLVAEALKRTDDNQSMAAKMLGVTRKTLRSYMG